jgi:hypothetical protein
MARCYIVEMPCQILVAGVPARSLGSYPPSDAGQGCKAKAGNCLIPSWRFPSPRCFSVKGGWATAHPRRMPKHRHSGNGQDESPRRSGPAMERTGLLIVTAAATALAAAHPDALSVRALPSQENEARATSLWLAFAFPHLVPASGPHILNVDRTASFELPIQPNP